MRSRNETPAAALACVTLAAWFALVFLPTVGAAGLVIAAAAIGG